MRTFYSVLFFAMLSVLGLSVRAQGPVGLSYGDTTTADELKGSFPLPTTFKTAGQDTAATIVGYAERFSSPFYTTYLDSVAVLLEIDQLDTVSGNAVVIEAVPEYVAGGHYFANFGATPMASNIIDPTSTISLGFPELYSLPMNHSAVDTDFFVGVAIPPADIAHDTLWLYSDSVTSSTQLSFNEERDRSRAIFSNLYAGNIEVAMGGTRWASADTNAAKQYWYPNFDIIAYVSSPSGSVAEIYPASVDPLTFFVERTIFGDIILHYTTLDASATRIDLFDESGREVTTLLDAVLPPESYTLPLATNTLSSGRYFCRVTSGENTEVRPIIVVR